MRIPSGKTDQNIYFVAVDATDLKTRETGLTSFTVYRSRNGAAEVAYTTPTVTEIDAINMPGVYALLVDEDTTIASTSDSEEYCVHITQASMAPVTRTIELYRRDTTSGETIDVASGGVEVGTFQAGAITAAAIATGAIDADALAADATAEIADAVWEEVIDDHSAVSSSAAEYVSGILSFSESTAGNVGTVLSRIGTPVTSLTVDIAAVPAAVAAVAVDGTTTLAESLRLANSANGAKLSGAATTSIAVRDLADTKNRIAATVDADGNRTAVTLDLT